MGRYTLPLLYCCQWDGPQSPSVNSLRISPTSRKNFSQHWCLHSRLPRCSEQNSLNQLKASSDRTCVSANSHVHKCLPGQAWWSGPGALTCINSLEQTTAKFRQMLKIQRCRPPQFGSHSLARSRAASLLGLSTKGGDQPLFGSRETAPLRGVVAWLRSRWAAPDGAPMGQPPP